MSRAGIATPQVESRSWSRREFDVWNEVPLVPQLTGMSCWAAAAAMVVGWRDRLAVRPGDVAKGVGSWGAYQDGLLPEDLAHLAAAWGLRVEPPVEWSVELLRDRLERNGPLWMGEASPGLHSIVVTGIYGDGSTAGTFVRINDPWPVGRGERYVLSFVELMRNFRAATDVVGAHAQVLHAGGRGRGPSRRWTHEEHHSTTRVRTPSAAIGHRAARALAAIPADEAWLRSSSFAEDPLAAHGGSGNNLLLRWNALDSAIECVDIVVHLHGYDVAEASTAMFEGRVKRSGVELSGRTRPTLAIVPRGRHITASELAEGIERARRRSEETGRKVAPPNAARYTFPGLDAHDGDGLEQLVGQALAWWSTRVLGRAIAYERVIFTAHSGGGAALNRLLESRAVRPICNPHEVHVHDGLYFGGGAMQSGILGWLRERVAADVAAGGGGVRPDMASAGGGMRVLYGPSTRTNSEWLAAQLAGAELVGGSAAALARWYRVENGGSDHDGIPRVNGPKLLADVAADVVGPPAAAHAYGTPVGLFGMYSSRPLAMRGAFALVDDHSSPAEQSAEVRRNIARSLAIGEVEVAESLRSVAEVEGYPFVVADALSEVAAHVLVHAHRQLGAEGFEDVLARAIAMCGGETVVRRAIAGGQLHERELLTELGEQLAAATPIATREGVRTRHRNLLEATAASLLRCELRPA